MTDRPPIYERPPIWLVLGTCTAAGAAGFLLGRWPPAASTMGEALGWLFLLAAALGLALAGAVVLAHDFHR